jgi:hypothetical protein
MLAVKTVRIRVSFCAAAGAPNLGVVQFPTLAREQEPEGCKGSASKKSGKQHTSDCVGDGSALQRRLLSVFAFSTEMRNIPMRVFGSPKGVKMRVGQEQQPNLKTAHAGSEKSDLRDHHDRAINIQTPPRGCTTRIARHSSGY